MRRNQRRAKTTVRGHWPFTVRLRTISREFDQANRNLLTVHHKDGNHHNNPADGSNWENLCAYCHEDVHSRGVLAEYLGNNGSGREFSVVYEDLPAEKGLNVMAEKLRKALEKENSG